MDADVAEQLAGERVLLTGGAGFLGSAVRRRLEEHGCDVCVPRSREYDLRLESEVDRVYRDMQPTVVIHGRLRVWGRD